jgi:hypothetical protein
MIGKRALYRNECPKSNDYTQDKFNQDMAN